MKKSDNLGELLKYYREKKGLSLQKMFEITGVSGSYINRLELGQRTNPTVSILKVLASALDIPMLDLLEFIEPGIETDTSDTSIAKLILFSDFNVNGNLLSLDEKKIIVDIIETLFDFDWNNDIKTKNSETKELLDLVDDLKNFG